MTAEPDAGDVEALADALLASTGVTSSDTPQGKAFRESLARRILASDWLAAHDAALTERVRRETGERIAQAIEQSQDGLIIGRSDAARIAREEASRG